MNDKDLKVGPELDEAVAVRVMGYVWVNGSDKSGPYSWLCSKEQADVACATRQGLSIGEPTAARRVITTSPFSTDMNAAWEAVESHGESLLVGYKWGTNSAAWACVQAGDEQLTAQGEKAPEAICRVLLKAKAHIDWKAQKP